MTQYTPPTPESELVARLNPQEENAALRAFIRKIVAIDPLCGGGPSKYFVTGDFIRRARELTDALPAATIERLDSELRLCRAALLAERMCADILEDGAEERLHSAQPNAARSFPHDYIAKMAGECLFHLVMENKVTNAELTKLVHEISTAVESALNRSQYSHSAHERKDAVEALKDFTREMEERVIPEIIEAVEDHRPPSCECCAELRVHLQTEREMHNAWRERAEEVEAVLASAHEQGRREGIEMAAKVADERAAKNWRPVAKDEATECADAIRALYVGRTE